MSKRNKGDISREARSISSLLPLPREKSFASGENILVESRTPLNREKRG